MALSTGRLLGILLRFLSHFCDPALNFRVFCRALPVLGGCLTSYHRRSDSNRRNEFLLFLGAGKSKAKVQTPLVAGGSSLPGLQTDSFSLCPRRAERGSKISGIRYPKEADPIRPGSTLRTSLNLRDVLNPVGSHVGRWGFNGGRRGMDRVRAVHCPAHSSPQAPGPHLPLSPRGLPPGEPGAAPATFRVQLPALRVSCRVSSGHLSGGALVCAVAWDTQQSSWAIPRATDFPTRSTSQLCVSCAPLYLISSQVITPSVIISHLERLPGVCHLTGPRWTEGASHPCSLLTTLPQFYLIVEQKPRGENHQ